MSSRNIVFFTQDKPALEGSGKSIRLMNWLTYLSGEYEKVYCIYFQYHTESIAEIFNIFPKNIEIIIISPFKISQGVSIWRRCIKGLFYPDQYNLNWYKKISAFDSARIINLLKVENDVFIFRLYLYPVLAKYLPFISKTSKIQLDLDDAESDTYRQIMRSQWKRGYFKAWLLMRLGYHSTQYYESAIKTKINTLYYSNPNDYGLLRTQFQNLKLQYFPNRVPYQSIPLKPTVEHGVNILFCGSLSYYPNIDAIYFLLNDIWQTIQQKIPNARLIIAGNNPSRRLQKKISQYKSVVLITNPKSMKDIFQSSIIMIVPLRIGGGTRIKILQAFSYGVPVVTTTIGISGIEATNNKSAIIRDTAKELAESSIFLIQDEESREKLVKSGYQIFASEHSISLNL